MMTERPTDLDAHRGMAAQRATEMRREDAHVAADQAALEARRADLEDRLIGSDTATLAETFEKAQYLLKLFRETPQAQDPRRLRLIDDVVIELDRHLASMGEAGDPRDDSAARP